MPLWAAGGEVCDNEALACKFMPGGGPYGDETGTEKTLGECDDL